MYNDGAAAVPRPGDRRRRAGDQRRPWRHLRPRQGDRARRRPSGPHPPPGRLDRRPPRRPLRPHRREQCAEDGLRPGRPRRWPDWIAPLGLDHRPSARVVAPGTPIGSVDAAIAAALRTLLPTRSSRPARRMAAPRSSPPARMCAGDAVTALGTTLTVKLLSDQADLLARARRLQPSDRRSLARGRRVQHGRRSAPPDSSRRRADGSARAASIQRRTRASTTIRFPSPASASRSPIRRSRRESRRGRMTTAPIFQGLLEGIAAVEALGYRLLTELGGPRLTGVISRRRRRQERRLDRDSRAQARRRGVGRRDRRGCLWHGAPGRLALSRPCRDGGDDPSQGPRYRLCAVLRRPVRRAA